MPAILQPLLATSALATYLLHRQNSTYVQGSSPLWTGTILSLASIVVYLIYVKIVYPRFLSPLRKLPMAPV